MLAKVLPDLEAADKLRTVLRQSQVPQARRPHLEESAATLITGVTADPPFTDAMRPPELQQAAQPGHSAGGRGTSEGSGLGALPQVNAPYRDSGERNPRAGCPGTRELQGDRYRVQSRAQS